MAKSPTERLEFLEENLDGLWAKVRLPELDPGYLTILLLEAIRLELRVARQEREDEYKEMWGEQLPRKREGGGK
jgi:hypothetical protein